LYARVSTGKQAEKDLSIPDQLRAMHEYCKKKSIVAVEEFVDAGRTARNDNRPQLQRMLERARDESDDIDLILFYSITRGFRNLEDMHYHQKALREYGVRFVAITEEYDEDDPQGKALATFSGLMAEMFSVENSKHVRRAMRQNAREGFFNGSRPPFGYKTEATDRVGKDGMKKRIALDDEEAAIVKTIYDLYENGHEGQSMGMKAITVHLNERNVLRRGSPWILQDVHRVLSDSVYCGTFLYGARTKGTKGQKRKEEPIPIRVPVIIDELRFKRIGVRRVERTQRKRPMLHTAPPSLLTGLCVCGYCGSSMYVTTGKGGRYRYLKCNKRNRSDNASCCSPNIPLEVFETLVLEALLGQVITETRVQAIFSDCATRVDEVQSRESKELDVLTQSRADAQRRVNNLYKLVEQVGFDPTDESFRKRLRANQDELEALSVKIEDLKVKVIIPKSIFKEVSVADFGSGVRSILGDRNNPLAKEFLRFFINEIRVYAEETTITGSNLGLVEAAIRHKGGTPGGVPSSFHKWRRGRDSNPRTLAGQRFSRPPH
jgi:site-specific DNA recombinase